MKHYSWAYGCSAVALLLLLLPAPAAAQQAQSSTQSKQTLTAADIAAIRVASQKKAMQDAEALPTPRLVDGHADLNGRWAQVKMICDKSGNCALATGRLLSGYSYAVDKDGTIHAERPPSHPLTGDAENRATNYYLKSGLDGNAARRPANPPPYKPELLAKVADLDLHENQVDPANIFCHPAGIPRDGAPGRIVQSPGTAVFLYSGENGNYWRIIPTDGRAHRTDIDPAYFGDSVAHWEGDTLVVDVNNFNDETWMGIAGWFHSDALHVVERITRKGNILHYDVTVDDPNVLTGPWVKNPETVMLNNDPDSEIYEQARCENQDESHFVNHDRLGN